jgi:hypothetical protein
MTLLNIVRRSDCVHLLTDGAGLNDSAKVEAMVSKCMIYPHLNMAIGFRGIHLVGMVLMSSFSSAISFDDVRRNFAKIVQGQVDATKSKWTKMLGRRAMQFDMAVAGWSKDGPRGLFLSTIERPGTPVFRAIEVDQLITPSSNILFAETSSVFARPDFSIERDMIAIAEKQRNVIEPYGPKRIKTALVGGYLQLTSIRDREISTRIIHRWDDKIGHRLNSGSRKAVAA